MATSRDDLRPGDRVRLIEWKEERAVEPLSEAEWTRLRDVRELFSPPAPE